MLDNILAIVKCILDFFIFYWFSMQFFTKRWNKHKEIPYIVLVILSIFLYFVNCLHIPCLNTAAAIACALVINFLLFKANVAAQLLCALVEVLLIVICEFIPISIYSILYKSDIATITNETIKNAGFNLIGTGIFSIIIMLTRYLVSLKRQNNKNVTITENLALIIVPSVSMLIIYYILGINHLYAFRSDVTLWQSIFIFFGILVMNIVVVISDNNLRKRYMLQRDLDEINRLEQLNRTVIEQQDLFIENLKGLAHDYTKQIDGLKNILKTGESVHPIDEEIQKYTEEMYDNIENNYRFAFIPTPGLRTILSQTQLHCNSSDITFNFDIQYAEFSFVSFPDLYSIFENTLENAITACREVDSTILPKEILFTIMRKKNLIWIQVKNTKTNPIIVKKNRIQTTKSASTSHGMGIENMKRAVNHYGGYVKIEYTADEFSVTLAIPVPTGL
ncbi:MAG: GHKL domain-containing protein [Hungatella sp.]